MSDGPLRGWVLPDGFVPTEIRVREVDGGGRIEWAVLDRVGAVRLAQSLRGARARLAARPARRVAAVLGRVGARFGDPEDPIHRAAVLEVARESGLSPEMAGHVVVGMARDWTPERLERLLVEEFGDPAVLDGFTATGRGAETRTIAAFGDAFALHLASGSVPGVGTTSLIRSLLVKTPVVLKPGAGDVALTVLFTGALREADPELADACAVVYWPGGEGEAEEALLARADRVVVYGDDDTVREVRERVAAEVEVVAYTHRIGFSVVGPGRWEADALARAVGTFDQRGCVTTHQVFAVGDDGRAAEVAASLAEALGRMHQELPRGRLGTSEASAARQRVEAVELRSHIDDRVRVFGGIAEGWAVLVEPDPALEPGPLGRIVRVVAVPDAGRIALEVDRLRLHLQTVGYGGFEDGGRALAESLGRVGATRIVPFASVAFPPAWWLHDGRGPLEALVRRAEWERES